MTKFSGVPINSSPALADYLLGVTAGGVDDRKTIQAIQTLIAGNLPGLGFWYSELGRSTLGVAGNTMTVNFTAKKYLKVLIAAIDSGSIQVIMRFNNDSAANYARRDSTNGGADGSGASVTECLIPNVAANPTYSLWEVINIAGQEKTVWGQAISRNTAGAANVPGRHEIGNKWANTSAQISRIDIINISGGNFAAGSEVVILGHD